MNTFKKRFLLYLCFFVFFIGIVQGCSCENDPEDGDDPGGSNYNCDDDDDNDDDDNDNDNDDNDNDDDNEISAETEVVDPGTESEVNGLFASLALDENGCSHISYCQAMPGGTYQLKYATDVSGTWEITVVAPLPVENAWTSLALDPGGSPHIAFFAGQPQYYLGYAAMDLGGTWSVEVVDQSTPTGKWPAIQVTPDGFIQIAYQQISLSRLKFATNQTDGWDIEDVGDDDDDNDTSPDDDDDTTTDDDDDDDDDDNSVEGYFTSMVTDSQGVPHTCSFHSTLGRLIYSTRSNLGLWRSKVVDVSVDVSTTTSIAVDSLDNIYLTYFDNSGPALKYATNRSGFWQDYIVVNESQVENPSIVLDDNDNVYISYHTDSQDRLKIVSKSVDSQVWITSLVNDFGGLYSSIAFTGSETSRATGLIKLAYQNNFSLVQSVILQNELIPPIK